MSLKFPDIAPGQVIELPGRRGKPDLWEVVRIYGQRVVLESKLRRGERKVMMDNQFDKLGYEAPVVASPLPRINAGELQRAAQRAEARPQPAAPRHPGVLDEADA